MDHYSPVAPAHVRVLVLPVGQIEHKRFLRILHRLQTEASIISLTEVEQKKPDNDGFLLSPNAFPRGSLLYRFSPAATTEQQQSLSPFELFREPLIVLGIVAGPQSAAENSEEELRHAAAYLKERHPRVVHRQLVVLKGDGETASSDIANAIDIRNVDHDNDPSLRSAVRELSARFLLELTTYAKAVQMSPTIQTPGQTARSLQRNASLRESEKRLSSGRSTPNQSLDLSSAIEEGSVGSPPSKPATRPPPLPATSFDQIPSANTSSIGRSDSRSSNPGTRVKSSRRASSQDRVPVQGFGSSTSQEKSRVRGKARVGIVLGSIYMLAGQWNDAMRITLEHTTTERKLADNIWYAKGLENMLVCMILLAWSGVEFSVPSICDPLADTSSSAKAVRIAAETRAAAEGTKQQLQLFRLSAAVPELTRLILSLYRGGEGSLELPFIAISEASIRVSKLLAGLSSNKGQATPAMLRLLVVGREDTTRTEVTVTNTAIQVASFANTRLSKAAISDILVQAYPEDEHSLPPSDHVRILAGIASSYASLRLNRKKAMTIRDMVMRLTSALIQARKLGAAEAGIHPAASLSMDVGADNLFVIAEESRGIKDLVTHVASVYGLELGVQEWTSEQQYLDTKAYGSQSAQLRLLRDLCGFTEASPDPQGVLWLTSALLRTAGPNAAVDGAPFTAAKNVFSREEQMHYATVIHRTVAVAKHLGMTDAQATYWDPFLVRDVTLLPLEGAQAVIDRSKLNNADLTGPVGPGNPLLYDPNASRPGTAAKTISVLVEGEESRCLVTLQNPFDIPVDIENLELVVEGVELSSRHEQITLGPLRFQQVQLMIRPKSAGDLRVTGCKIKMQGCREQVFPIVAAAWSARTPLTIKDLGLEHLPTKSKDEATHDLKSIGLEPEMVFATVLGPLPALQLEAVTDLDAGLMLLEGESRTIRIRLTNKTTIAARVFEVSDTMNVVRRDNHEREAAAYLRSGNEGDEFVIEHGDPKVRSLDVTGQAGVDGTGIHFFYCADDSGSARTARVVSIPVSLTVNSALQVQNMEVTTEGEDGSLLLSLDVRNAWPKSLEYQCSFAVASGNESPYRQLDPGEVRRVHSQVPQSIAVDANVEQLDAVRRSFLSHLRVRWRLEERSGIVDPFALHLSDEALELVRGAPVAISVKVVDDMSKCIVGAFVRVRIELINRLEHSTSPLLVRLEPRATNGTRDERRVAVAGTLQRILPPLKAGAECAVDVTLCLFLAGVLEMDGIVQPAHIGTSAASREWHNSKSCRITVRMK